MSDTDRTAGRALVMELTVALRWSDTDALGHVYHAVHLSLIEEARTAWLNRATAAEGLWDHVVLRVAIDYRSALSLSDDPVRVTCEGVRIGRSSLGTREVIWGPENRVVAEAESTVVPWNRETSGSRPLSDAERRSLRAIGGLV